MPLYRKKPRINQDNPAQSINDLVTALPGAAGSSPPTTETFDPWPEFHPNVDAFYEGLKMLSPGSSMLQNRYENPKPSIPEISQPSIQAVPTLMEKIAGVLADHPLLDKIEGVLPLIIYSVEELGLIEAATRGQAGCESWFQHRKGRVTASNFKKIANMRSTTDPQNVLKLLLEGTEFDVVPKPLAWGKKKEIVAQNLFLRSHRSEGHKFHFRTVGLCISQEQIYLGASPDGIVDCEQCGTFLLEIKCPYAKRNFSPKLAAVDHCFVDPARNLQLDPKSYWYYQIQGQLGICKVAQCKLVVYTSKGIHVINVPFHTEKWEELRARLGTFYLEHLGPKTLAVVRETTKPH